MVAKGRAVVCGTKISYPSPQVAHQAARKMSSRHGKHRDPVVRPYHCDGCGRWHLADSSRYRDERVHVERRLSKRKEPIE